MPLTTLPPTPSPSDTTSAFNDKAFGLLGALPVFVSEANALETNVNAKEASTVLKAGEAADSAAAALISKNAAADSATIATDKAAIATDKAGEASASAASALGYLQAYRATSYGALASDPTLDPNGGAPTVGDEYFNTTANLLKRFNGATWQASDISTANLAASTGAGQVGSAQPGVDAVTRSLEDRARDYISLKDYTSPSAALSQYPSRIISVVTPYQSVINLQLDAAGLRGVGSDFVKLDASGPGSVLKLGKTGLANSWAKRAIEDLNVNGNGKIATGIAFDSASTPQLSGRWNLNRLAMTNCDVGVSKPRGNIGNSYSNMAFSANNIGYKAVGQTSPIMHGGCDSINTSEFSSNSLAAIYIDSPQDGTGGTSVRNTIIESNPGFGFYVKSWKLSYTPLTLDNVWFESNATGGLVTLDGSAQTPRDIKLIDTTRATIVNGMLPKTELVNSTVMLRDSFVSVDASMLLIDATSTLLSTGCHFQGGAWPMIVKDVVGAKTGMGNSVQRFYVEPRSTKVFAYTGATLLQSISFADADKYTFTGSVTVLATTQADGIVFDSCAELVIAAGKTQVQPPVTMTAGKWYVFSIDIASMSGNLSTLSVAYLDVQSAVPNIAPLIKNGMFSTIAAVGKAAVSGNVRLYIINSDPSLDHVLRLSALQFVEFSTEQDALNYLNAGIYMQSNKRKRRIQSTAAPTTGTWSIGDRCDNNVSAVGQSKGWDCTANGTPGTWVSEGNL